MGTQKLDSPQLRSMRWKLSEVEAIIAELNRQREAVRQEIVTEQARLVAEAAKAQTGFVLNMMARWEQDMTVPEIASALAVRGAKWSAPLQRGERLAASRFVAAGQVPERRRVRDAHR